MNFYIDAEFECQSQLTDISEIRIFFTKFYNFLGLYRAL
jgi:hypothetical protein